MGLLNWLSKKKKDEVGIEEFSKFSGDDRLRLIMKWGDQPDDSKLEIFQYAIVNDSDTGVKMAALKRIHLFHDKENVQQFLIDEKTKNAGQACEPYYSMALSRTGIISVEEFQKRMNA